METGLEEPATRKRWTESCRTPSSLGANASVKLQHYIRNRRISGPRFASTKITPFNFRSDFPLNPIFFSPGCVSPQLDVKLLLKPNDERCDLDVPFPEMCNAAWRAVPRSNCFGLKNSACLEKEIRICAFFLLLCCFKGTFKVANTEFTERQLANEKAS